MTCKQRAVRLQDSAKSRPSQYMETTYPPVSADLIDGSCMHPRKRPRNVDVALEEVDVQLYIYIYIYSAASAMATADSQQPLCCRSHVEHEAVGPWTRTQTAGKLRMHPLCG